MKVALVVNALAARKSAVGWRAALDVLAASRRLSCQVIVSETAGQAMALSREAAEAGCDLVVAVGGDGTVNECANGIMAAPAASKRPILGTIPLGSGCDFARSIGVPRQPLAAARGLESGPARRLDVGLVEYSDWSGDRRRRFFINVADVGAGGVVVREAVRAPRLLGRRPNYVWGMLAAAVTYSPKRVNLQADGVSRPGLRVRNIIVANGRYFGRGFVAAPDARMDDGMFDVVSLGDFTIPESIWRLPRLRAGTHLTLDKVHHFRASTVAMDSQDKVLLELDGELVGVLPASFQVVPSALETVTG